MFTETKPPQSYLRTVAQEQKQHGGRVELQPGSSLSHSNNLILHQQRAEIAELKATVKSQGDHIVHAHSKLDAISEQLAHLIRNQNIERADLAPIPNAKS